MPSPQQLRLFSPDEFLAHLVESREDQWLERKSQRVNPRQLAETLVSMANAEGGLLVIGVHDGAIEGTQTGDQNEWRQAARNFTDPPVRHTFELVPCRRQDGHPDEVAVIEVESSEQVHRLTDGRVLLRVGDEDRRLREAEVRELEYDKGQSVFDGRPVPGTTLQDLSAQLTSDYLQRLRSPTSREDVLLARGLAVEDHGELRPTTAGILLLSELPQRWFPEAWMRVLVYRGKERLTGMRANVLDDQRFEGPLQAQIEGVSAFLRTAIPTLIRLQPSGRFEREPLIPEPAWLEAIVNAAIHRSYSMMGDHVRIELFDDRLEVESPGRLPGLVRLENIRSSRFARNPRIARVLSDFGYGRELGEGVDRMFERMREAGLPEPKFEQRPASLRVELNANPELARLLQTLPPWLGKALATIQEAGSISTGDVVAALGLSRPTVLKHLRGLEDLGLIQHVGSSRKDPRGVWRIREQATRE